jgi:hypothetical protein
MHKNATKCNKTIGKWCKNKHGASKIIDTFETYQATEASSFPLSGGIGGTDRNPYTEVGAQLHNSIGGSQQKKTTKLLHRGSFEVTSFPQGKIHGGWVREKQITWIGL